MLKTGIPWELLPQEMGCGSGMTCWRRLRDWQRLHHALLNRLGRADQIDWGGPGSKHHLLVDRQGIPLAVTLSG